MVKQKEEEMVVCPVGRFFMDLQRVSGKKSGFFEHLSRSQVEFLKAIRSLVDEKIETLEFKKQAREGKKATKIEVEEG